MNKNDLKRLVIAAFIWLILFIFLGRIPWIYTSLMLITLVVCHDREKKEIP